jgi:hypothetical protein
MDDSGPIKVPLQPKYDEILTKYNKTTKYMSDISRNTFSQKRKAPAGRRLAAKGLAGAVGIECGIGTGMIGVIN